MKKLIYIVAFITSFSLFAQQQKNNESVVIKKLIDKGLQAYNRADYEKAEINFRKALAKDPVNAIAAYDLGLTKTEEESPMEALRFFHKSAKNSENKILKSKAYFNEGNIWYEKQKYEKAIEAYKNALRNNPTDEEARYNLALAMQKLKKQNKNKQNKQNKQNQKNKDQKNKDQKNKNQKNKDQKNKDQKNKKGNKDQKNKGDQNKKDQKKQGKDKKKDDKKGKDKKDKGEQKKDQKNKEKGEQKNKKDGKQNKDKKKQEGEKGNQPQNRQGQGEKRKVKLTPQQVKQLLIALKNKEQKTQKKVKAKVVKAKAGKKKQDKDW